LSRIEKQAFSETGLIEIVIPASVEMLGKWCFLECGSLTSVIFESDSRLSRIEKQAFSETGLIEIAIPASVEVLGDECFRECIQLRSVTFESGSRLREIGRDAFSGVQIHPILPEKKCCPC
jgi:hypothetical protein